MRRMFLRFCAKKTRRPRKSPERRARRRAARRGSGRRVPRRQGRSGPLSLRRPRRGRRRAPSRRPRRALGDGCPARIRVLDDHRRGQVSGIAHAAGAHELVDEPPGGLRVEQVQVRQLATTVLDGSPTSRRAALGRGSARHADVGSRRNGARRHAPTRRARWPATGRRRPRRRSRGLRACPALSRRASALWRRHRRRCGRRRHGPGGGG